MRIPLFGDKSQLPVLDHRGELMCIAAPDSPFDALDPAGAREAGRRRREARAGIEAMRGETHAVDMGERLQGLVAKEEPAPVPESAGVIRLGEALGDIGRELRLSTTERLTIEDAAAEQKLAEQRAARTGVLERLRANAQPPSV